MGQIKFNWWNAVLWGVTAFCIAWMIGALLVGIWPFER